MKKVLPVLIGVVLGALSALAVGALVFQGPAEPGLLNLGSVARGGEMHATTTGSWTALLSNPTVALKSSGGALGSVTVTGANTGVMHFYNATTTNVNARTGNLPTSSIWLASVPASAAAGTYVFDAVFFDGLFVEIVGTPPTSTITFR